MLVFMIMESMYMLISLNSGGLFEKFIEIIFT